MFNSVYLIFMFVVDLYEKKSEVENNYIIIFVNCVIVKVVVF